MLQLCQCLGGALHISSATGTWAAADGQPPAASAGVPGPSAHEASCTSAQNPAWRRTLSQSVGWYWRIMGVGGSWGGDRPAKPASEGRAA